MSEYQVLGVRTPRTGRKPGLRISFAYPDAGHNVAAPLMNQHLVYYPAAENPTVGYDAAARADACGWRCVWWEKPASTG